MTPTLTSADRPKTSRRIPDPPARLPTDTAWLYGASLFCYVVREDCAATLTDEQLELAAHASHYAVTTPDATEAVRSRLSRARHLIADTLRSRAERAQEARPQPEPAQTIAAPDRGPQGPPARLRTPLRTGPGPGGRPVAVADIPF